MTLSTARLRLLPPGTALRANEGASHRPRLRILGGDTLWAVLVELDPRGHGVPGGYTELTWHELAAVGYAADPTDILTALWIQHQPLEAL